MTNQETWIHKFRKAEMAVLFVSWVGVALLQMKRIKLGMVTSYGADVFMPAWLYVCAREGKTVVKQLGLRLERPVFVALGVFALCVGWEVGQKFHWIRGVYDPFDIVSYAVGIGGVLLIDLWLLRLSPSQTS